MDLHAQTVNRVIALLRQERQKQGISQEKLAKMAEMSRTGIRHVESSQFNPTLYTLLKIAEALKVSLPRLIAESNSSPTKTRISPNNRP